VSPNYYLDLVRSELIANVAGEFRDATTRSDMETAAISSAPVERRHILCVDDEVAVSRMRAEILKEHGYEVVLHHSPVAALQCDLSMFDLAILDFRMPELNGRELLLRMRALGVRFPILLLTGCLETLSSEDRTLFARCIDKGMPVHRLLDAIAEFMDPNHATDYGS
jgi:CheY-like chemotaxis protein